jgi:CubicO group peptidase (beta-lactamase class C family)
MKYLIPATALLILLYGCTLASGKEKSPVEDSLECYPPTPQAIGKNEFRRLYREISSLLDSNLLKPNFNGSILFAKNGNIVYEKYQGLKDRRGKDSVTAETPFHIASTSKTFTGVAVLKLAEQGKLSLDDSMQTFFP